MTERTFPATKKRLLKARKDGKVIKTPGVTMLFSLTSGISLLYFLAPSFFRVAPVVLLQFWGTEGFKSPMVSLERGLFLALFLSVLCITPCAIAGIVTEGVQLGFTIFFGAGFKPSGRIAPGEGVKRIFTSIGGGWIHLVFVLSFSAVTYRLFRFALLDLIAGAIRHPIAFAMSCVSRMTVWMSMWMACCVALEYSIRRYQYYKGLKMSMQEIKDEHKESEGDGHIKAHRKALHRALVQQDLESRIKRAKVIVVERACSQTEQQNI